LPGHYGTRRAAPQMPGVRRGLVSQNGPVSAERSVNSGSRFAIPDRRTIPEHLCTGAVRGLILDVDLHSS
jgi:hypothetical protein